MTGPRIGIVGAGIGGLAAALFLARAGLSVTLYERFEAPRPIGAGFLLQPTGMAVLAALGVYDVVRAAGAPIERLSGETIGGRRVMDLPYADLDPALFGLGTHRGVVFQALFDAVSAERRIAIETGAAIRDVDPESGRLVFETPTSTSEESDRAQGADGHDLIIAADGANSALRRRRAAVRRDAPYEWACVWAIAPDPGDDLAGPKGRVLEQRYDGARRFAGLLPIGRAPDQAPHERSAALFWSLRADAHAAWLSAGAAAWKAEMRAFWPRCAAYVEAVDDLEALTLATYRDVVVRRPFVGRVAFIGDAAHAMSPQLGQGANLALLDAWSLSQAIDRRAPFGRDAAPAILADYAAARRRQVGWYQLASRWLTPVFQSSNPIWGWARDLAFHPISRIPAARREMLAGQAGLKSGLLTIDRRRWRPGENPPA